ncbi:hypothetical protein BJ170DRAFT_632038 [Xylariales sp. AK1849]|nr:hypothetical protein BJ170DRAFT_632038 [Xylariales sp. AK1849]
MNYPFRFVFLGIGIISGSYIMRMLDYTSILWSATRIWGMLYLFIALWVLSLFGDDALFEEDKKTKYRMGGQLALFVWSLIFGLAAATSIWHGLRYSDGTTKGFGLTFLGINLYTKFFEYFWNRWYKSLFFAVLAGTLAVVGRYAENVWSMQMA